MESVVTITSTVLFFNMQSSWKPQAHSSPLSIISLMLDVERERWEGEHNIITTMDSNADVSKLEDKGSSSELDNKSYTKKSLSHYDSESFLDSDEEKVAPAPEAQKPKSV